MSRRKKINKFKVSIVIIIFVMFLMTITGFGRFVYNTAKDRYLSSKKFYFTSNLLTTNLDNPNQYTNWDGNGIYEIEIDLFSQNNELEQYTEDLTYSVIIGYDDTNILCALDPNNFKESTGGSVTDNYNDVGTISATTHKDTIKLYVKPNIDDDTGEEIDLAVNSNHEIRVRAYTTVPYKKTLGSKFNLKISEIAYEVKDQYYNQYNSEVILNVSNNYDYDSDVTIDFREDYVRLDLNDSVYIENSDKTTTDADGIVSTITFTMPAESSRDIRFYKKGDHNPNIGTSYFTVDRVKKE